MPFSPIDIPVHTELYMQPGGVQITLTGIAGDVAPGGTIPLTLRFGDGRSITVEARLLGTNNPGPDHHDFVHIKS